MHNILFIVYRKPIVFYFLILDLENIAILQKTLILCAAISCCSMLNDKLCCPLFEESKLKFAIVCVLSPVLFGLYIIGFLLYIGTFPLYALCLFPFLCKPDFRYYSKLVFTWPCVLCGLYTPYMKQS